MLLSTTALSAASPLLIGQSAPFSVSSLSSMAPEPVGQNHLSAREEGQLDMPQPLEKWISAVPCLRTKTSSSHALRTFTLLQCQSETCHSTHRWLHIPKVPHTVTLPKFLNVPRVVFVFPPTSICFACFLTLLVNLIPSHFPSPLALTFSQL